MIGKLKPVLGVDAARDPMPAAASPAQGGTARRVQWAIVLVLQGGMAVELIGLLAAGLWLHGVWALAHLALAIYFGERFAEACQKGETDSTISETNLTQ